MLSPRRGIGRSILSLVNYWRSWGHEVVPLQVRRPHLPLLRNFPWRLAGAIDELDVVFFPEPVAAGALHFFSSRVPTVVTVHDLGVLDCEADRIDATFLTGMLYKWSFGGLRHATLVTTDSNFTRQRLQHYNSKLTHKATPVLLGVDHSIFYPRDRGMARQFMRQRDIDIPDEAYVIIYAGAEYRRKNIATLLAAFSLVRDRLPGVMLVKVGAAHSREDRRRTENDIIRHGLQVGRDIQIVEDVDDESLAYLYSSADVFVSTTLYEGFGLPLLEALACGLPAVVSDVGSLPEVGGDAVDYVAPLDENGFAETIIEVSSRPRKVSRSRSIAQAGCFSWEKTAQGMLDVLIEAIGRQQS